MKNVACRMALQACLISMAMTANAHSADKTVPFGGANWRVDEEQTVEVRNYLGREALFIERAIARMDDANFGDGVLEYDVAAPVASGFVGINFRIVDGINAEQFYVRFHQTNQPDATQYLPVFNGLASWQIHAGPNETGSVSIPAETWIRVKIVVKGDKADIYVGNDTTPLIHVPDLYHEFAEGPVALYAGDRPGMTSGAYFSNISVRELRDSDQIVGVAREETPPPVGTIKTWQVSAPFSESEVAGNYEIGQVKHNASNWSNLEVERNGIANLAKVAVISKGKDTVLVKKVIRTEKPSKRLFRFGYSDRVRIYVNGEQVFFGNAGWRLRDHRFLGTIGFNDAIVLALEPGDNEIVAAVSESFGGWGFAGQIEDQSGLTIIE